MGLIYHDGQYYGGGLGGDSAIEITQAELDALSPAEKKDKTFFVTDGVVPEDKRIDELEERVAEINTGVDVGYTLADGISVSRFTCKCKNNRVVLNAWLLSSTAFVADTLTVLCTFESKYCPKQYISTACAFDKVGNVIAVGGAEMAQNGELRVIVPGNGTCKRARINMVWDI